MQYTAHYVQYHLLKKVQLHGMELSNPVNVKR